MNKISRQEVWSQFWSDPSKQSCSDGVKSSDSEIDVFWNDCAESLSAEDTVVDLCTGNGAVIDCLAAHQLSNHSKCSQYIGVDWSNTTASQLLSKFGQHKIQLHSSTSIENMPITESTADIVSSQFGLEYCITDKSISEISRIAKDTSSVYLVTHHSGSILGSIASIEIEHIEHLHKENGFLECIKELIPYFSKLRNPANLKKIQSDSRALAIRGKYNVESERLFQMIEESKCPNVLEEALNAAQLTFKVAQTEGAASANKLIDSYIQGLSGSTVRQSELIDASLSESDVVELAQKFSKHGKQLISQSELSSGGHIVAWGLIFK